MRDIFQVFFNKELRIAVGRSGRLLGRIPGGTKEKKKQGSSQKLYRSLRLHYIVYKISSVLNTDTFSRL